MEMTRHVIRAKTVAAVYSALIYQSAGLSYDPKELLRNAFDGLPLKKIDLAYQEVFAKALAEQDAITAAIDAFLAGWTFERLSMVTQAIFLVSYSETVIVKCVPKPVSINEAINLAREFVDEGETKYVNAVLERTLSKALGIPGDYGKVVVAAKDMALDSKALQAATGQEPAGSKLPAGKEA